MNKLAVFKLKLLFILILATTIYVTIPNSKCDSPCIMNKAKILFFINLVMLGLSNQVIAQQTVSGQVKDAETGEVLIGATVLETGTTNGVITDIDGNFSLSVSGNSLTVSYIGYIDKVIETGGRTIINVSLMPDLAELEEVIVIGYGTQTKKVATASISSVNAEDLASYSVPNVGNALQGQVSGVIFKNGSGSPGSGPTIFIRGIGTNGDNSPLVIIDGLIAENPAILNGINPDDIENISVLKDAASAAIYGSRGANGVIIVTTKNAEEGQSELNYQYSYGIQQPWKIPDVLDRDQYIELISEKYANAGQDLPQALNDAIALGVNTDWMDALFETGYVKRHDFSYRRGTKKGSYRASLSVFDNEGTIAPDKNAYKRINARFNSENKINDYVKFGQNLAFVYAEFKTISEDNAFGGPISSALVYDPLTPIIDRNATFGFSQSPIVQKEYTNPFSQIFLENDKSFLNELYGNSYVEITPIEEITFKSDIGFSKQFSSSEGYTPDYEPLHPENSGNPLNDVFVNSSEFGTWIWTNTLGLKKKIDKHSFDVLLGYAAQSSGGKGSGGTAQGLDDEFFASEAWRFLQTAPDDSLTTAYNYTNTSNAILSQFGRIIYAYDDKYLFTFILRRDGSDKFGSEQTYGIFPSVSAGWIVSDENFWSLPTVNYLKVRASFGENGNDRIQENAWRSLVVGGSNYQFGSGGSTGVYQGLTTNGLSNPNLKWETSRQFDVGFEVGLFDNKLTAEFDYYNKTTIDLLGGGERSSLSGADPATVNVGSVENRGIEIELGYRNNFRGIQFSSSFTLTTLNNEVTKVDGITAFLDGVSWPVRNFPITRMEVGKPIGYFRGYKTDGIFQSQREVFSHIGPTGELIQPDAEPGDFRFVDINGDGELNDDDVVEIGNPWADVTMGLRLSAAYKGFELTGTIFASLGSEIYRTYERQDVTNNNYQVEWLDRWTPDNTGATYPRVISTDLNQNQRPSDFYVESGNYLRLKNIQLSYSFSSETLESFYMKGLRVFVAADNLITLTGYTGFDPEVGFGGTLGTNIDNGTYPLNKTITFGISGTF